MENGEYDYDGTQEKVVSVVFQMYAKMKLFNSILLVLKVSRTRYPIHALNHSHAFRIVFNYISGVML